MCQGYLGQSYDSKFYRINEMELWENVNFREATFSALQMTCFKTKDGISTNFDSETLQNTLKPEKRSIAFSIISHQPSKIFPNKIVVDVKFGVFRKKQNFKEMKKACA